jgi:hypothetical protein
MTTTTEVRDTVTTTTRDPLAVHLDRLEAALDWIIARLDQLTTTTTKEI